MITKTGAFCDECCTCPKCGNTHEFYGGKGYDTHMEGEAIANTGVYHHVAVCRVCGSVSDFIDRG